MRYLLDYWGSRNYLFSDKNRYKDTRVTLLDKLLECFKLVVINNKGEITATLNMDMYSNMMVAAKSDILVDGLKEIVDIQSNPIGHILPAPKNHQNPIQ